MNILGYASPIDFFTSLYGSKKKYKMNTILAFAAVASLLLQVQFIESWIWKPVWTLVLLTFVLLLDFLLAVTSSKVVKGETFKTEKATKFTVSLLAYWLTLGIAYNMPMMMTDLGVGAVEVWQYFGKAYFFFIFFLNLVSALKHMSDLGYLPKVVARFFIKYIDAHKNSVLKPQAKTDIQKNEGETNE